MQIHKHTMKRLALSLAIVAILLAAISTVAYYKNRTGDNLLCPSQYATDEEATLAMQTFTNNFFDVHPDASLSDWANARHDFYVSHNCKQELAAYQQVQEGNTDPATMKTIDKATEQTLQSHKD